MVFWEIIRWLVGERKKAEQAARYMSPEEAKQYVYKETLRKLNERLALEAKEALKVIEEAAQKEQDHKLKKLLNEIARETRFQIEKTDPVRMRPQFLTLALATAEAVKRGIHKDPDRFTRYLLKYQYEAALKIFKEIPYIPPYSENKQYWNAMRYFIHNVLDTLRNAHYEEQAKLAKDLYNKAAEDNDIWVKHPDLAHKEFTEYVKKQLGLDWWDLTPEEILEGRRRPREEKPTGAPVLARPDRYPTLTQKILLKTLILGEHLREDNKGVHRDLYRALRNLLTTPLTTSNWYPFLTEWFENLEKGQHTSPLTQIIQKLPIHPTVKQEAYRYLAHIEQGKPIDQIPEKEKRAFKRVIEQIKQAIWLNPNRYAPVLEQLAYTTGMNPRDAAKALIGIIDDLAKVYTGEKTPRQVGIERDATQVIHTIKNLQDRGNYIDPYHITQTLTNIIEQHIQDPLLKEAYKLAIKHYQETTHQVPRNHEYLEKIMEKERELEEKLKQLAHGERKLTDTEAKRITMLYRTLMLLAPHPTLKETKQFYSQLAHKLKIRVGDEEFLPLHGPIAEDVATSYSAIRKAGPEEKEEVVRREIASFEPLFHTTPHIEKKVASILSTTFQLVIPKEKHEEFLGYLEVMQVRSPIE